MMILIGYVLLVLASAVIAITMFVRANDERSHVGLRWHVRKLGFVLAGTGTPAMTATIILMPGYALPFLVEAFVGFACVFITTPGQRPWLTWIWRDKGEIV